MAKTCWFEDGKFALRGHDSPLERFSVLVCRSYRVRTVKRLRSDSIASHASYANASRTMPRMSSAHFLRLSTFSANSATARSTSLASSPKSAMSNS